MFRVTPNCRTRQGDRALQFDLQVPSSPDALLACASRAGDDPPFGRLPLRVWPLSSTARPCPAYLVQHMAQGGGLRYQSQRSTILAQ